MFYLFYLIMSDKLFKSKIDIKPKVDFENGINLNFQIVAGPKGKEAIEALPEYFKTNPVTVSFEIGIEDAEKGPEIVQTLEGVKEMVMGLVPNAEEIVSQGVLIKFRHVGKSVFIDVSVEGMYAELINQQLSSLVIDLSQFQETGELHIISGLKLDKPLETSYEDLVKQASQFKIQGNGELPLKTLYDTFYAHFYNLVPSEKAKKLITIFGIIKVFRKLEYTVDYDSEEMQQYIKDLAGSIAHNTMGAADMNELNPEIGTQMLSTVVAQGQEMGKMQLEGIKAMAMSVLEPYKDSISQLNLDCLSLSIVNSKFSALVKFNISLVGISQFIRENILN